MHGVIDAVESDKRHPKMEFTQRFIEHATGNLGVPVVDSPKHSQHRRDRHYHMKMRNHEVGVRQRDIDNHVAEKNSG